MKTVITLILVLIGSPLLADHIDFMRGHGTKWGAEQSRDLIPAYRAKPRDYPFPDGPKAAALRAQSPEWERQGNEIYANAMTLLADAQAADQNFKDTLALINDRTDWRVVKAAGIAYGKYQRCWDEFERARECYGKASGVCIKANRMLH